MPSPPSPATNLHFLLAYSPRRFLPASASAVPFGDITLVLSAASNFLVEQSQMSGEAGTEHSKVDLHGQGEGRICSLCSLSLSLISAEICISLFKYSAVPEKFCECVVRVRQTELFQTFYLRL